MTKSRLSMLAALAVAFALVELAGGFGPGYFLFRGRVELDAFLTWRPWTALALAAVWAGGGGAVARRPALIEAVILLALVAAATAGPLAMVLLWHGDAGRALGAFGAGLVMIGFWLAVAMLFRAAAFGGIVTRLLIALFGLAFNSLTLPWAPVPLYERAFAVPAGFSYAPPDRPRVGLLTGLPLAWGEEGPAALLSGRAHRASILTYLDTQFRIVPVDAVSAEALAGLDALLIAQPRPPSPAALAAVDAWVRGGGRVLLLVDPDLHWPSQLPAGHSARAPRQTGLDPLLAHWGVRMEPAAATSGTRLYRAEGAGQLLTETGHCRPRDGLLLDCRLGKGRALLLPDADLLHGRQWAGMGRGGTWDGVGKNARTADTPLFIAGLIDESLGRETVAARRRSIDGISWVSSDQAFFSIAVVCGIFPALIGIFGLATRFRHITHQVIHRLVG